MIFFIDCISYLNVILFLTFLVATCKVPNQIYSAVSVLHRSITGETSLPYKDQGGGSEIHPLTPTVFCLLLKYL